MSEIAIKPIKQGEGKLIKFNITDPNTDDAPTGLDSATFAFGMRARTNDSEYAVEIDDADFIKTDIADGIVYVKLTPTITAALSPKKYVGELEIDFGSDIVDKSLTISIEIREAVIR